MKITKEQIEKIYEETMKGKSAKEIAEILNITVGMVEYQRKKNKWKSQYDPNILNKYFDEIVEMVRNNISDREIAEKYNCTYTTVYSFRKKNKIERDDLRQCKEKELSSDLIEILVGTVLGDTSLRKCAKSTYISCEHSIKQKEYVYQLAKDFESLESSVKNTRVNTDYPAIALRTKGTPSLNFLYDAFYKDNIKCMPFDLINKYFTERSLAYLLMDDGYPIRDRRGNVCSIGFSLCSFRRDELEQFI